MTLPVDAATVDAATVDALCRALAGTIPAERLIRDPLRLLAYGTDASFYRLTPKLVVMVESEAEVVATLRHAADLNLPVTFRAAGTSLSGQAVTDSVLILLGDGWTGTRIADDAATISLQPGVIGAEANRRLAPYGRKIGPDPASINAAKIGGIAANNASGMCCGTAQNSYQTLQSMRLVLADGTVLDTADPASVARFRASHGALLDGLRELAEDTRADTALARRIRDKFSIKNTTGYSLNALIDFDDPIDILQHLMIGSEGTLGFISEVTYRTVVEHAHKATALFLFPDARAAGAAVPRLGEGPVAAVELIDRAGLAAVQDKPGMPPAIAGLGPEATALLVETRAEDAATLRDHIAALETIAAACDTLHPAAFSTDAADCAKLWAIRKGLFPSVGAVRETGTTVIIEDIAVRVEHLADMVGDLHALFARHGYDEAIIFGHALAGNLHFVFTQAFDTQADIDRYAGLMDDVAKLVVDTYDGSLKAEHGTGRNMAPFVEMEWGAQAYALMRRIKDLLDPQGLLNPGVIFTDDPKAHVKHLKPLPAAHPVVDTCIECGFCEPKCPSHGFTLSPRQRITAQREIARLTEAGETAVAAELIALYDYAGIDTCAACSLCSTACPVGIDTGRMTKDLRGRRRGALDHWLGRTLARHYGTVLGASRLGLTLGQAAQKAIGRGGMAAITRAARRATGNRTPVWLDTMPAAAAKVPCPPEGNSTVQTIVYFPSCAVRTMGPSPDDPVQAGVPEHFLELCRRADIAVRLPEHLDHLCCGMPFESKGFTATADDKSWDLEVVLRKLSEDGRLPIVFDTSPCTLRMRRALDGRLPILDIAEAARDLLLPRLSLTRQPGPIAVHLTCSTRVMGVEQAVLDVAKACAEDVVVPPDVGCCAFAGDKGFTTPEFNAFALRSLRDALPRDCTRGVSTSRTCEIGLSHHSGRPYQSIIHLLEACSRETQPADTPA